MAEDRSSSCSPNPNALASVEFEVYGQVQGAFDIVYTFLMFTQFIKIHRNRM